MNEVTHNSPPPRAIQTETPAIVTTVMQSSPELTMVTTPSTNASFSVFLHGWALSHRRERKKKFHLKKMTKKWANQGLQRIRKIRLLLKWWLMKIISSMLKLLTLLSRNLLWRNHIKYAKIVEPLVEPCKQTRLSYQHNAHEVVNFLSRKNDELRQKKMKLKEENACMLRIIKKMKRSSASSEPISIVCTEREKRKVHSIDEWSSIIEKEGIQVIWEVY